MLSKSSRKSSSAAKESPAAEGKFPLFFKHPAPLDVRQHSKASIFPSNDFSFTTETNSIAINGIEFVEAAKHYPIIFLQADIPLPVVVLGLEKNNYFVNAKGAWKEDTYIPAYVRKYPFVFMDVPEQKTFILCVDEAASAFAPNTVKGALPLYKDNEPSELTRNALEFCTAFHNHSVITRRFCEDLKAANILVPSESNTKLFNNRKINLGGFQVIDEKKLNALPDETILDFHKKGWLPLIYFALMSASHWKKLADMAGSLEPKK